MAVVVERTRWALHPLNAVLPAGTLALSLGALLSDIAYFRSYEIQWNNFSSWLLAGGLVVGAFAFPAAIVELFRNRSRARPAVYVLLLLATWILGCIGGPFVNDLSFSFTNTTSTPTSVPEPNALLLMLAGIGLVGLMARLRKA